MQLLLERQSTDIVNSKLNFKFIDLCSGIGSSRLALEQHGMTCVGYSEIDHKAIKTYKTLFNTNDEINFGDLLNLKIEDIPDIEFLIAGFPCQPFSVVGQRKGFNDERGQIIFKINEILKVKQPEYFILENVKGLRNLNNGFEYRKIIELLKKSNYNVYPQLLNSYDYGVPQMRERIYFVGIRNDMVSKKYHCPMPKEYSYNLSDYLVSNKEDLLISKSSYETFLRYLNNKYNKGKYDLNGLLKKEYLVLDTRQSDLRIYDNKIPTLRTGRHGILYVKKQKLRTLSAKEALLLQGFAPYLIDKLNDDFSETTLLSQAGNAMTVNVIYQIVNSMKRTII